jgi:hypothetical protein
VKKSFWCQESKESSKEQASQNNKKRVAQLHHEWFLHRHLNASHHPSPQGTDCSADTILLQKGKKPKAPVVLN